MIEGSCLCGAIKFQTAGELDDASFCHCSVCRKATGSALAAYGSASIEQFDWIAGKESLQEFRLSAEVTKFFCSLCSSILVTHHSKEPGQYHISLGCVDNSPNIKPLYHQYVDSKPSWSTITDTLRQYPGWPDDQL